ncbi:MAG: hypothetical protein E6J43_06185 [Chloroflexi bacterium]|nr:MAG: hypothetical protein E6J43_06185 [Chloroflexota bacterium]
MVVEDRRDGEGEGAPLNPFGDAQDRPSIPQDERNGACDEPEGASGDPWIRPSDGRATRGERNGGPEGGRKGAGGPKTTAGKALVARNAIKHGVLAQTPVLPLVESEEEWAELRQDVLDWFDLRGPFRESLGERAAMLIWRLKRAARAETEATRAYQKDVPEDWKSSMMMEGLPIPDRKTRDRVKEECRMLMARLLPGDETMDKILRYESKLHRYLLQTLYMILVVKGLKQARSGRFYGVTELDPPEVSRKMGTPPGAG